MPSRGRNSKKKDLSERAQAFRYFIDVQNRRDASVRALRLCTVIKFRIPLKKNVPPAPSEEILQIEDGATTIEGKNFDELAARLRQAYPDDLYERTLRRERDYEAESAREVLINLLVKSLVNKFIREKECQDSSLV